jgi:hypothetical protein
MAKTISIGGRIRDAFTRDTVQALSTLGYQAMMNAYAKRGFQHRTRNLHDSYGSAVYVDGVLIEESIRYIGGILSRKVDPKTKKTGRETLEDYFHSHRFGVTNHEIVVIVVAAMYYSGILESQGRYVITPARDYIDANWENAMASVLSKYGIKEKPKARVVKGDRLR